MSKPYVPAEVEAKWQEYWLKNKTFRAERHPGRPKRYVLDMFPYPSASGLHVGHLEGYTATDIYCRYLRSRAFDVLHPMGWDAFGLPAEQYAIQTGTHPAVTTGHNVDTFRRQIRSVGFSYDWDREVDTTDPGYFRWTQWIFLKLFERGLAYQSAIPVNWCPALGTVLANEEVIDGLSERGNHPVVRLPMRQWMLRITAYGERLLADLEGLDWPEGIKAMQRNWIGRSEGADVLFLVSGGPADGEAIRVFTTRPDTLFGATYMVLAPEHPLTARITTQACRGAVEAYVAAASRKSDRDRTEGSKEKTGVFTGAYATNPTNGARIPVWIGDYVLGSYGTGAIMAVPAHDERDFAFAVEHALPIVEVVSPDGALHQSLGEAFVDDGVAVRSGPFDGLPTAEVKGAIVKWLEERGLGTTKVNFKLRDWVFSRQRYWGEPIPIVFPVDTEGDPRQDGVAFTIRYDAPEAVSYDELPLTLPVTNDFQPTGGAEPPLARAKDWRFVLRNNANGVEQWYARETNTMPQWAGSCWYYLRFMDAMNTEAPFSKAAAEAWQPVDLYVGGAEHAVLHLLYARFWHKVLHDEGLLPNVEPFARLVNQGMILGEDNEKMSKSRGNVVSPDVVIADRGADAVRLYEMFMGPLEQTKPWSTAGIGGVRRFLDRAWTLVFERPRSDAPAPEAITRLVHKTIKKVTEDIEGLRFNTGISAQMILVNELMKLETQPTSALEALALLLGPFAPHVAEEIWEALGHAPSISAVPWPGYDPALCIDDVVTMAVQIGGKVRAEITVARDAGEESIKAMALADERTLRWTQGATPRKVIIVKGKLVNIVV